MRLASHGHITPVASAAEAVPSSPTGTNPHRRVMRAAWALYRDRGGNFAETLSAACQHEKAQAGLSAVNALRGHMVDAAYICGATEQLSASMLIDRYAYSLKYSRNIICDVIELLVSVLDFIDGDTDFEHDPPEKDADAEDDARELPRTLSSLAGRQNHEPHVRLELDT